MADRLGGMMTVFRVVAYNDLRSEDLVVADVLNRACGLPLTDAVALTRQIGMEGKETGGLVAIPDAGPASYPLAGVDDWIEVLGQARLLWVPRGVEGDTRSSDAGVRNAGLFTELQGQLVAALRPALAAQLTGEFSRLGT